MKLTQTRNEEQRQTHLKPIFDGSPVMRSTSFLYVPHISSADVHTRVAFFQWIAWMLYDRRDWVSFYCKTRLQPRKEMYAESRIGNFYSSSVLSKFFSQAFKS